MCKLVKIGLVIFNILVLFSFQSFAFEVTPAYYNFEGMELEEEADVLNDRFFCDFQKEKVSGGADNSIITVVNKHSFIFFKAVCRSFVNEISQKKSVNPLPFYIQNCSLTLYA
ncbi:hypothetical protein DNU06_02480 [Putridiphycobacter roseus]|uniref:Uncharacterized protein n=1 Tax=Putridiphycobacter roseus TaxID=2219161 RepID=A0A2W1NGT6_9FLAO|nr:hypothetical protein [Putridiphycobacter roseus]PZE18715.1 hypothetical protein DNU06_02480 [Putridiphycobacter roseus]